MEGSFTGDKNVANAGSIHPPPAAATASTSMIRSSAISAISIEQLFGTEGKQVSMEYPSPLPSSSSPPSSCLCLQNTLNRIIRTVKDCLRDRQFANELLRTSIAACIFVSIVLLMTLAQMFSDRWFALYTRNLVYVQQGNATLSTACANGQCPGGGGPLNGTLSALAADDTSLSPYAALLNLTAWQGMAAAIANGTVYATDPLFDHVSVLLPDLSTMRSWLPDAFLTSFLAISLTVTLLFPHAARLKYQSIVVGRRIMWILSILYLFRMASFLVTTVPNPVHNCIPKYPQDPASYLILMGRMATGKVSACTDNIYSGHTTLATVLFYTNVVYARRWYFSLWSALHVAAILFAILLTRLHYSVDVLIALFMTSFVYCLYHFLLLIHVDGHLLDRSPRLRVNRERLEAVGEDGRLLAERRLILRLTGDNMMRLLAWMDGMDLRTRLNQARRCSEGRHELGMSELDERGEESSQDEPNSVDKIIDDHPICRDGGEDRRESHHQLI